MNWNLEGLIVSGRYMGVNVIGRVELSRVKYGGTVSHHLALTKPVLIYGTERERVILDHHEIDKVKNN